MENVYIPTRDPRAAWYEIGMVDDGTLGIRVHVAAIGTLNVLAAYCPGVDHLQQGLNLPDFLPPTREAWGFGEVLRRTRSEDPHWRAWECVLPVIKEDGETFASGWEKADAVRATLSIIFTTLWLYKGDTSSDRQQLMVIENMAAHRDINCGAISATLTPAMMAFLSRQTNGALAPVADAMRRAGAHMWRERDAAEVFQVRLEERERLILIAGMDAGLSPELGRHRAAGQGYTLISDNMGRSFKQLAILAGLAALHDLARWHSPS